ncbi:flavin reductase family protein [Actinoplanes sp. Pm04-4]|uniref:Flavin reductase family protein n=1 Tax=Paractinoplanes pyxinae TaxID=2997416 RepID=A0ABT4BCA5_9ACTN|nr:flavin reductase family protein [Actinoplanes pyxinae]MCY1143622.1 flavin reductase family protein [Actinoplanes pyxinae]
MTTGEDAVGEQDHRALRDALGTFATGVTIITMAAPDGSPGGLTVNSFTSVSLDPPLVLWCLRRRSRWRPVLAAAGRFAVNVLASHQRQESRRFAGRDESPFDRTAWQPGPDGVPLIDGALAHFVCRKRQDVDAGDHVIILGEVEGFSVGEGEPLVFHGGGYFTVGGH